MQKITKTHWKDILRLLYLTINLTAFFFLLSLIESKDIEGACLAILFLISIAINLIEDKITNLSKNQETTLKTETEILNRKLKVQNEEISLLRKQMDYVRRQNELILFKGN